MRSKLVRVYIDLSVVSIHSTYNHWAAAPSAKMPHGPEGFCVYYPPSIRARYRWLRHIAAMFYISLYKCPTVARWHKIIACEDEVNIVLCMRYQ
jgi:hypothetical protein